MKKLVFLMVLGGMFASGAEYEIRSRQQDFTQPFMSPGSPSNPYVVRERYDGKYEIRTRHYDFRSPYYTPGSPGNPWIMERRD